MNRIILAAVIALAGACNDAPNRYCVDESGTIYDDWRCGTDVSQTTGYQWVYYNHVYHPGQTVVIRNSLPTPARYVSGGTIITTPAPRTVIVTPTTPATPVQPRVSTFSARTSPAPAAPRISTMPARVSPSPARVSAPARISTMRSR